MTAIIPNTCRACLRRMIMAKSLHTTSIAARSFSTSTLPATTRTSSRNGDRPNKSMSTYRTSSADLIPPGARRATTTAPSYVFRRSASTASASATSRSSLPTSLSDLMNPKASSERPPIHVTPPSLDAIKEEGYLDDDVQLIPTEQATLLITPEAIAQLERITSKEPKEVLEKGQLALRVGVESGGCHGYQYTMEIVEERGVDDYVMQPEGVNCIPVIVDLVSLGLLKGATLHHATELIGSSFRLQDNPQAKEGGNCGCGVSWELK